MKVDIYKIHHSSWGYIIVPTGTDIDALIKSLPGFPHVNFKTYRRIQSGHDTYGASSALNNVSFRSLLSTVGYKFSHRIRK
ncbi:hypothetical protein ACCY16_04800 [Candidatus Pantoea formicae]|uniref:hypothetical protein n=1 Tax=Candidatus Pantoea formicae TaxID=2608355 RepID=UPI003EDAC8DF